MALQVRRGTNAERLGITPLQGELIYVTDTKQLYVGDGTTVGGTTTIANTIDSLLADTSPQLGGELDLNGNNITGTGNINITGTITASGTVNLGDGVGSDILVIGGAIQGHLVPDADSAYNLGSSTKYWNNAWLNQLTVDSQITAERVQADIIGDDSSLIVNISTNTVTGVFSGNLTGDVTGNVSGTAGAVPFSGVTSTPTTLSGYGITDAVTSGAADAITATMVAENVITSRELANGNSYNGTFDGDLSGSVFSDNSTVMLDAQNLKLTVEDISVQNIAAPDNEITFTSNALRNRLSLQRQDTTDVASNTPLAEFVITRKNTSTNTVTGIGTLAWTEDRMVYIGAPGGTYNYDNYMTVHSTGKVAISMPGNINAEPAAHLEVGGAIKPGVYADPTARDAAITSPAAGMMVFVTNVAKFQGYDGSAWVNLN